MNIKQSFGSWFSDLGFGFTTIGLALFVLVVIFILVADYMSLTQKKVKEYEQAAKTTRSVGTQENKTFSEDCEGIDKAGNPLIGEFMRMNNRAVGNLIGNIDKISFDTASTSATIDMTSKDGYQHYQFTVQDQKGLVAKDVNKTQLTIQALKYGQAIAVSFECDAKTKNKFLVTQIEIILER